MIEKAQVVDLTTHLDDRGSLTEVLRVSWELCPHPVRQVYIVHNRTAGIKRAWHRHGELWDLFSVVHGSAVFGLVDMETAKVKRVVLSAEKLQLLVVPPPLWHGWCSLEPDTFLLSIASHEYNREEPDEKRLPPGSFAELFGRDPFEVWHR